jgi:hypothetical protein
METTHKPLYLHKWRSVQQKIIDIPTSLFEFLFCYTELLIMAMVRNFEVMMGEMLKHSE